MVNDLPDPAKFLKVTGDLSAQAAKAVKVQEQMERSSSKSAN